MALADFVETPWMLLVANPKDYGLMSDTVISLRPADPFVPRHDKMELLISCMFELLSDAGLWHIHLLRILLSHESFHRKRSAWHHWLCRRERFIHHLLDAAGQDYKRQRF